MATLALKEFRCVEETDESGSDSPYFLVYRGWAASPVTSVLDVIRLNSWDNEIDTGDFRSVDFTVGSVNANAVALVAVMEEDVDPNFTSNNQATNNVRSWMKNALAAWGAGGSTPIDQLASKLIPEFKSAINANRGNDDIVDVQQLKITTLAGLLPLLHMKGDGGYYKVRFKTS